MTDNSFDPPQRLVGRERIARNAVQEAFEAVDGPLVELACETGPLVIDEHDIAHAFAARGHELPANGLRCLAPLWDRQNGARIRVQRPPSNPVGRNDWQEPMPSPEDAKRFLTMCESTTAPSNLRAARSSTPTTALARALGNRGSRRPSHSIPTNAHVVIICGTANILRDAGNGPAVLGRPEVAVQDDLPGRRGPLAFDDRTGTRSGIVVQWEEHGPAKPRSRHLGIRVAGPQHGDRRVSESFPSQRGVAPFCHCGNCGQPDCDRSKRAFTAACLGSHNGPAPLVGDNVSLECPVGNNPAVVLISSHPSRRLSGHAHQCGRADSPALPRAQKI